MRKQLLLLLASALLTFVVLEAGVRIFQPLGSERQPEFLMDERAGWIWAPNQRGFIRQINYGAPELFKTRFRTNSLGLRDREFPLEKDGNLHILALGDSFTQGWGVEEQQAFPKVLESEFLRNAEVWNLGVVGYSTDQELELLRKLIDKANPDLVVLAFYENDIADNTRGQSLWYPRFMKPRFAAKGDTLEISNSAELIEQKRYFDQRSHSALRGVKDLLLDSAVVRLAYFAVRKIMYERTAGRGPNLEADVWARNNSYRVAQTEEMKTAWDLTERLLAEVQKLCDQHRAGLVLTYIPRGMEILPGILQGEQQKLGLSEPAANFDLSLPERTLEQVAARHQIRFIPMRAAFLNAPNPESLYLPVLKDGHLSPKGQHLVASTLAARLQQDKILPALQFSSVGQQ